MGQRARGAVEEMSVLTDVIDLRIDGMQTDLNLLKWAVGQEEDRAPLSKVKVPDPKAFGGERSANELENFLWDMEIYFQAAKVPDAEKVSITSLQPWAQTKLRRQGVKDLPSAIAAANRLAFKVLNDPEQKQDDPRKGKAKFGKKFKRKEKAKKVVIETSEPCAVEKSRGGCFICGNLEHRARDCLKRGKLNAIVAEQADGDSETKQTRVGALQLSVL
ncbi:UNVERIFIED_CONTAM: hypothetical protein Slati_3640700 [Sesamum latifolium]|uniref:CCHC-type domain-containing protein n=1 Tax=Sesamum latifolium TaxID=2727402 RepID=A0AAW2TZV8_9LAMI